MAKRGKSFMLLNAQKQTSGHDATSGSFSWQIILLAVIGAIIILLGFVIGSASQSSVIAQSSELLNQQQVAESRGEVRGLSTQQDTPKYFSQTEVSSDDDGLMTQLLTLGALVFAGLGAIRFYKVMTGKN